MASQRVTWAAIAWTVVAFTAPAVANVVRNASQPGVVHAELGPAIDAAAEGDVLFVGAGTYSGFTIDGKSLTIAVWPGAAATVLSTVEVKNLASHQAVHLIGLEVAIPNFAASTHGAPGLRLTQNAGHVRIRDGVFGGGHAASSTGQYFGFDGGHGVEAVDSLRLVMIDCTVTGGRGGEPYLFFGGSKGGLGGDGFYASNSRAALFRCALRGGDGGDGQAVGGRGGHGFEADGLGLFASGSSFTGGKGGEVTDCLWALISGDGGDGVHVVGPEPAELLDDTLAGGPPGTDAYCGPSGSQPGSQVVGAFNVHPGVTRILTGARLVPDAARVPVTVLGTTGEGAFVIGASRPAFTIVPALAGAWLVQTPFLQGAAPLGVLAAGQLSASLGVPDLRAAPAVTRDVQALLVGTANNTVLTSPWTATVVDRDAAPDCNGNGVVDWVDLLEGTSLDADGNLVPDECDYGGRTWYVDPAATPPGSGTAGSPFTTIRRAMDVAASGHTILLANGVYTGPDNRALDFGGRDLAVKSTNGPFTCAIDCQDQAEAFLLTSGETAAARIEGVTIRNGLATTGRGGAIHVSGASPTIAGCFFFDCDAATSGGAIYAVSSGARIEDCHFQGNAATPGSSANGGGAIHLAASDARVVRCTFDGNSANGGGGALMESAGRSVVSHCTFRANAAIRGGAAYVRGPLPGADPVRFFDCLFEGNQASRGGGLATELANGAAALCTFVDNQASQGGALYAYANTGEEWRLSNSILWGNAASTGAQIAFNGGLRVDSCDVQGGQAGVAFGTLGAGGTLVWGAGNLSTDPLFAGPTDYRLSIPSPCIDAGDNTRVPADLADVDGDGNTAEPLPLDLDLAPRFVDVPSVPDTGIGTAPIVDIGAYERVP